ncbi:hypothetical protein QFZ66_002621 [Streptomyces sp. B4I13]|nr:hypothetical protein [Streptomyces sp. B4I13]
MIRFWKLQAAAMGVAACFSLGLQGTANAGPAGDLSVKAHPSRCTDGTWDNGWYVVCGKSNGGKYRAWVRCLALAGGPDVERDAVVWKSSGQSIVSCPPFTQVKTGGMWTQG